jgi:hypothetical protein
LAPELSKFIKNYPILAPTFKIPARALYTYNSPPLQWRHRNWAMSDVIALFLWRKQPLLSRESQSRTKWQTKQQDIKRPRGVLKQLCDVRFQLTNIVSKVYKPVCECFYPKLSGSWKDFNMELLWLRQMWPWTGIYR